MGVYDLSNLLPWTRRASGDSQKRVREVVLADGSPRTFLSNGTSVVVDSIQVDNVAYPSGSFTTDGNMVVWASGYIPVPGAEVFAIYDYSKYGDDDLIRYLADAARVVQSDVPINWAVYESVGMIQDLTDTIIDINGNLLRPNGSEDITIEKLVVYRACIGIYEDKANNYADGALSIRDDGTGIDTSKRAAAAEKVMQRLREQYQEALMRAKQARFFGSYQNLDHNVVPNTVNLTPNNPLISPPPPG